MPRKIYRNTITSEENWERVNHFNKILTERFLKNKNNTCADLTIDGYESDCKIFFTWNLLYNDNKEFHEIEKIEFSDFFSFGMSELRWSSSRYSRLRSLLSSLSEFFEKFYVDKEKYKDFRNIINKVIDKVPKTAKHEKTILSEKQVNDLLDYLFKDLNNPQEACLLALAISSGARVSEWLRIDVSLIDENNLAFDGIFIETLKEIKTKGHGKSGKPLYKYLIKDIFLPYYHAWLPERQKIMEKNNKNHDFLFIKSDGEPATVTTIRSWITKWEKFLNVPFYPHCLRHYITTYLTKLGLSSDFIIAIMGWSSAEMYKTYNDLTAKEREWKDLGKLSDALQKNKEINEAKEENK